MKLEAFLRQLPRGPLWIFGYGSLMWSPGFRSLRASVARVHGYHRALCILSHRHRGTPDRPGLVMGLCRGGSCWGMAYQVAAQRVRAVLAGLWKREMMNYVYMPRLVALRLKGKRGAAVRALAFVADPTHPQFARELSARKRARLVAQGVGGRGRCVDYISETIAHMRGLGVHDPHLERLLAAARALPHGRERTAGRRKRTARR